MLSELFDISVRLEKDFGNPTVVSCLKMKTFFDMTQLPTHDKAAVINYQCKLKATVTSLILRDAIHELDQLKTSPNPFLAYQTTFVT